MAAKARNTTRGALLLRRLAWAAGVLAVLYFAVEGGEYGTTDLLKQRDDVAEIEAELALLRDTVAALDSTLKQVSSDDFTLERIAREEHGLVKGEKELLYWVDDPSSRDSTLRDSTKKSVSKDTTGVDSSD
jgi:cell division protein FtsB